MIDPEQFARHLRSNRGVGIELRGSVVPPGWFPPPEVLVKLVPHHNYQHAAAAHDLAITQWRIALRVSCLHMEEKTPTPGCYVRRRHARNGVPNPAFKVLQVQGEHLVTSHGRVVTADYVVIDTPKK